MRTHTRLLISLLAATAVTVLASHARASNLPVGGTILAASEPDPSAGATLLNTVGPVAISSATFSGTLTSEVFSGDANNSAGGLTFVYLLQNLVTSPGPMDRLTINGYTGFLTDASYKTPGQIPSLVTRDTADVVGFSFVGAPLGSGVLSPGSTSAMLVVQTDALQWQHTTASVIDGSTAGGIDSLSPAPGGGNTPEPSTLALAGGAAATLLARRRRSRRA